LLLTKDDWFVVYGWIIIGKILCVENYFDWDTEHAGLKIFDCRFSCSYILLSCRCVFRCSRMSYRNIWKISYIFLWFRLIVRFKPKGYRGGHIDQYSLHSVGGRYTCLVWYVQQREREMCVCVFQPWIGCFIRNFELFERLYFILMEN
jgi:hypothetical protein